MDELPRPISLTIRGMTLDFHFFCTVQGNAREKVQALGQYFSRVPDTHLAQLRRALFVIVPRLGGGRDRGGGFSRSFEDWFGRERRTGVPDTFFTFRRNSMLIGITRRAFDDNAVRPLTILHECGHCIHRAYPIYSRGDTIHDFRGIRYSGRQVVEEYAAETYSRYIVCPSRIGRVGNIPAGENMRSCTRRLTALLMASPAGRHFRHTERRPHDDFATSPLPLRNLW